MPGVSRSSITEQAGLPPGTGESSGKDLVAVDGASLEVATPTDLRGSDAAVRPPEAAAPLAGPVPPTLGAPAPPSPLPSPTPPTAAAPPSRLPPRTEPPARQVAPIAVALALGHAPRLTITLQPAELGRVELRLDRGADGEATELRIIADRPETLLLLQRDARELTRALDQAGVRMDGAALSFDLASEHQGDPGGRAGGGGGTGRPLCPSPLTTPPPEPRGGLGLLDIAV